MTSRELGFVFFWSTVPNRYIEFYVLGTVYKVFETIMYGDMSQISWKYKISVYSGCDVWLEVSRDFVGTSILGTTWRPPSWEWTWRHLSAPETYRVPRFTFLPITCIVSQYILNVYSHLQFLCFNLIFESVFIYQLRPFCLNSINSIFLFL